MTCRLSQVVSPTELGATATKSLVIDTGAAGEFAKSHVPGTINVPASNLVQWAGFFVDYNQPVFLIADEESLPTQLRSLRSIGIDNVGGFFDAGAVNKRRPEDRILPICNASRSFARSIDEGDVTLIDVRAATEFHAGHIAGAEHRFLGTLLRNIESLQQGQAGGGSMPGGRSFGDRSEPPAASRVRRRQHAGRIPSLGRRRTAGRPR